MANIIDKAELFPMLPDTSSGRLVRGGMARAAEEAVPAGEGHLVEFMGMKVRSVLNRTTSRRGLRLSWSVNPYRGCEFACRYCYARYTHQFLAGPDQDSSGMTAEELFERRIFVKQNAAWLLEQELRQVKPGEEIALGTATDPYQPVERREKVTRSLLEVFARQSGLTLGIITKSALIYRDLDLLTAIARKNTLVLHVTVTTPDARLARLLEPRAPRPDLRLATVKRLREAALTTGVLCSPLLPGITDHPEAIDAMAASAAAAGASFFAAEPLFLKPCSRPTYLSFVREHFPHLFAEQAQRFQEREFAEAGYKRQLAGHVEAACRRHGLQRCSTDALLTRPLEFPAAQGVLRDAAEAKGGQQRLIWAE